MRCQQQCPYLVKNPGQGYGRGVARLTRLDMLYLDPVELIGRTIVPDTKNEGIVDSVVLATHLPLLRFVGVARQPDAGRRLDSALPHLERVIWQAYSSDLPETFPRLCIPATVRVPGEAPIRHGSPSSVDFPHVGAGSVTGAAWESPSIAMTASLNRYDGQRATCHEQHALVPPILGRCLSAMSDVPGPIGGVA